MDTDPLVGAVPAASWSLSLGHFGQVSVIFALSFSLLSALLWLLAPKQPKLEPFAKLAFGIGCASFVFAFFTVATLFVNDQFQFKYVFEHGSKDNQLRYKIAGTWSGQEGSILLWGTTCALFGLITPRFTGLNRRWYTIVYAGVLASISAILAFESPFTLIPLINGQVMVPTTGQGMPASLLNYWVVIHPPTIFTGFGSLTVLFAWSTAALIRRDLVDWIQRVRPWALLSLAILGLGLAMGGFWAYETLGWGGFWAWDPVENTSFVPWVAVAAFLHGLFVQVSRKKWYITNALLAGLPFLLFCYGTFLTRSGFLGDTSVHSFAEMDHSALWILISINIAAYVGFLTLWGIRAYTMRDALPVSKPMDVKPFNRELAMGVGIWLLVGFGIVTAIGMSIPVMQSIGGHKPKVVEETLYDTVLSFLWLPLTIFMAVGPFVTWRGLGGKALVERMVNIFAVSIGITGFLLYWIRSDWFGIPADFGSTIKFLLKFQINRVFWVSVLTWFSVFGIVATLWKLYENFIKSRTGVGGMLAHLGVGLAMLGLVFSRGFEQKSAGNIGGEAGQKGVFFIPPNTRIDQLGFGFMTVGPTKSYVDPDNKIAVKVFHDGQTFEMTPGLYFNGIDKDGNPTPVKWPGIRSCGLYDLYLVIHDLTYDASGEDTFKPGVQRLDKENGLLVTYHGLRTEGPLGQKGAKFFAKTTVEATSGEKWDVEPMMTIGDKGIEFKEAKIGDLFRIKLTRMNAADKSATLQILYTEPAYYAELYYKPLTLFVWLGIGIMTFGAGLTAWTRRYRPNLANEPKAAEPEPGDVPESKEELNAPEPTAES